MSELKERLDNLRALMQEPEFLEGKGLSNEVNIRIFCYDPSDEMMVRHFIEQIMTDQSMNCHLIEHNLYEVFLSICEDKRIAKTIPAMEEKKGKGLAIAGMVLGIISLLVSVCGGGFIGIIGLILSIVLYHLALFFFDNMSI